MKPFVKWAGGKGQLVERLYARMPKQYNTYFEPFVGAGAMLFYIQTDRNAYINDINKQLIHAYETIRDDLDNFLATINDMDKVYCDKEHYYEVRNKYNSKISYEIYDTDTAALFVYINKHCFNGLYRVNSKGLFNVPWNKKTSGASIDEENIKAISQYLNNGKIKIMNMDFEGALKTCSSDDFVYFDSPYDILSKTASFADYTKESFKEEDHRRLAVLFKRLTDKGVKCMLTNHNTDLINELYKEFSIELVDVRRAINSDASKRMGKEVIITNY